MDHRPRPPALRAAPLVCLAFLGCSGYFKVVERGKYSEAAQWFKAMQHAEELRLAETGRYEPSLEALKKDLPPLRYFTPGKLKVVSIRDRHFVGWSMTLVRGGAGKRPCSTEYGCYAVTFSIPAGTLACDNDACQRDLVRRRK